MTTIEKIVAEAKKLKKQFPKRFTKWTDYVKQASAIYRSKSNPKTKKKVGYLPERYKAEKEITKIARNLKKSTLFPYTHKENLVRAGKEYYKNIKVSGVKKPNKKTATSTHKDTKSHNVNIRVVSGTSEFSLLQIKRNNESLERLNKVVLDNKNKMKSFQYKTPFWQSYFKKKNKEITDYMKTLKKQNTQLKKHI